MDKKFRRQVAFLTERDDRLGGLIKAVNTKLGLRNQLIGSNPRPPLEALLRAVVGQQLSGAAARTIFVRLKMLFNGEDITADRILKIPNGKLRGIGISAKKTEFIKNVGKAVKEGELNLEKLRKEPDHVVLESLQAINGIGPWTAEMYLIFHLQRPDVLPSHDLGIRRGVQIAYGLIEKPSSEEVGAIGLKWSPYRTLASRYLWEAVNMKLKAQ
jgi:DNA-3-methyladenine glycosylase II